MLNDDHSGGRDGSTKVEVEAQVTEDDGASAQVTPQVELRDPEQEGLPDGHEGTGGERQGESQAAVEPGPDEPVDVQPDRGEGEPATEAGLVRVRVALDGPTAYGDWPEIPHRLATRFDIFVLPAKAPAAMRSRLGLKGRSGILAGSSTLNCSPMFLRSRFAAIFESSRLASRPWYVV